MSQSLAKIYYVSRASSIVARFQFERERKETKKQTSSNRPEKRDEGERWRLQG